MKVQLKTKMAGPDGCFDAGAVIQVSAEVGGALVAGGFADELDQGEPQPETATIAPPEMRRKFKR